MRPHEKLEVWETSIDLVVEVYKETDAFPKEERFTDSPGCGFGTGQHRRRGGQAIDKGVCSLSIECSRLS